MKTLVWGALALTALHAGTPVWSQSCIQTGSTVTCTGAVGPFSSVEDDLNVAVAPLARVSAGTGDALGVTGANVILRNRGQVLSIDGQAVSGGDGLTVFNRFDPTVSITRIEDIPGLYSEQGNAISGADDVTVVNELTIAAGRHGVQIGARGDIGNSDRGGILAVDKGITGGDDLGVANDGLILAVEKGVEGGNGLDLENNGIILAGKDAVQANLGTTLTNRGVIQSSVDALLASTGPSFDTGLAPGTVIEGDAIKMDDGHVMNLGLNARILSQYGAGIDVDGNAPTATDDDGTGDALIFNEGLISGVQGILVETQSSGGDHANTSAQNIVNYGTIIGTGGTAIQVGAGDDSLTLFDQSSVQGVTLFGEGQDLLFLGSVDYSSDLWEDVFDGGGDEDDIRFAFALSRLLDIQTHGETALRLILSSFDGPLADATGTPATFDILVRAFETASFDNGDGTFTTIPLPASVIPLPAPLALLGGALLGLGGLRRRRR